MRALQGLWANAASLAAVRKVAFLVATGAWASAMAMGCSRTSLPNAIDVLVLPGGEGANVGSGGAGAQSSDGASSSGGVGSGADVGGAGGDGIGGSGADVGGSGGGAGSDGSCQQQKDCEDGSRCTVDRCVAGQCTSSPLDEDNDGFSPLDCGGEDCNDANANARPGQTEDCFDGTDNDCNGVKDCQDSVACTASCGCSPTGPEDCTNGEDDDCDGRVDCGDPECLGTLSCGCVASEVNRCGTGIDEDCDGDTDCEDSDCSASALCACQAQQESCVPGQDLDCDKLTGCADPSCAFTAACLCEQPTLEDCANGADDDCDGKADCADPQCVASPACQNCAPEQCTNGADDDCDGRIDCADDACAFAPQCAPILELCNNGLDDDSDGATDCQDTDCVNNPTCAVEQAFCTTPRLITASGAYTFETTGHINAEEGSCGGKAGEVVFRLEIIQPSFVAMDTVGSSFDTVVYVRSGACGSGAELGCDDDGAGQSFASQLVFSVLYPGSYFVFVDGFTVDPDNGANEGDGVLNLTLLESPSENCADGVDNDGDIHVDCADQDCSALPGCAGCVQGGNPTAEFGVSACSDGLDNDCDGESDCADSDCVGSGSGAVECCDGIDNNGNNIVDDFGCRCSDDGDCDDQQLCYGHSIQRCGPPCTNFFGDVCPFLVPGSTCNDATEQCEF